MSITCNCETPELEKSGLVAVQPKASTSTWAIDRVTPPPNSTVGKTTSTATCAAS